MKIQAVKKKYTPAGIASSMLLTVFFVLLVTNFVNAIFAVPAYMDRNGPVLVILAILITVTFYFIEYYLQDSFLNKRKQQIQELQLQNAAQGNEAKISTQEFILSSLDDKENIRNSRFVNTIQGDGWAYADFEYDIYKKTKHGEYKAYTIYYAVMMVKLPRQLPHVLFDSFKSRRRQFRLQYASGQTRSLEGNFDKHFVTYYPNHYDIDSLSFITPEVMQALVEADEYDIEISHDRLFVFGDMREASTQVPEMLRKITAIKKALLNNIVTYRDERLPYTKGRQQVTAHGAALWQNLTKQYFSLVAGLIILLIGTCLIIFVDMTSQFAGTILYICVIGGVISGGSFIKIRKELKRRKLHGGWIKERAEKSRAELA